MSKRYYELSKDELIQAVANYINSKYPTGLNGIGNKEVEITTNDLGQTVVTVEM